jgi:23S rRNA (uracil1939-C5)-methyltransferase
VSERLTVTGVGHLGDGLVDSPQGPLYVAYALPGETVDVGPEPGHADRRQLLRVETPSADRLAPICPHFGLCGGCALQHWDAEAYRTWKRELVVTALEQADLAAPVDALIDAHGAGRRRVVLHARRGAGGAMAVGFAARRAHHLVAIEKCPVLAPPMRGALAAARAIACVLDSAGKPLDIHITAANEGLDVDVRGSGPLRPAQSAALARIAVERGLARLTRHGEIVVQPLSPTVTIGRANVPLPPATFLQPTEAGEAALAALVSENAGAARHIVDLFCGIGPFALRLAERARLTAADLSQPAVSALARAAASTPRLKPVETAVRDLFRRPFAPSELARYDAAVFDPPRQGAQMQAQALAASRVPLVIAVSCSPATFARDARILVDAGYRLRRVTPVDQFRYSPHVEIVARLER